MSWEWGEGGGWVVENSSVLPLCLTTKLPACLLLRQIYELAPLCVCSAILVVVRMSHPEKNTGRTLLFLIARRWQEQVRRESEKLGCF